MTKNTIKKPVLTDADIENALMKIAVENGLSAPFTPSQLDKFTDVYAGELMEAQKMTPNVNDLIERANAVRRNSTSILCKKPAMADSTLRMAARNGNTLTTETKDKMNAALKKTEKNT